MKLLKPIFNIGILLLFLFQGMVQGQISQGGMPIQIQKLKSITSDDLIILPAVDNEKLQRINAVEKEKSTLKSFHFAHPFDTVMNPKNSGKWYSDGEVKIWQLRIRSVDAYSLNVIFGHFNLPENARLFLIGVNSGEIKGAYTSDNNSESQVLAVEPLAGDEILIQYEEPVGVTFPGDLEITRVSHDFIGIKASGDHRPLGISGVCNVNVNCGIASGSEDIKDAVCRLLIEGTELCTGTLVNNTRKDGTPYLLTAYHCINTVGAANTAVFLFNYESPTCVSIDGDVSHSLSGSSLIASFDSLDFALVRLVNTIPFVYHPYLAGWNRRTQAPSSSMSIHHPLGDIKKVAIDNDIAATGTFNSKYRGSSFWRILKWDSGVTENGSSGGPLFDQNKQLIGTLTGGSATCANRIDDYFAKFALAWDYRKEPTKQLKAWLDPTNSNVDKIVGLSPNTGVTLCKPVTNFENSESYAAIQIVDGTTKKGYFSGTNVAGFTDFAEQYKFSSSCEVQGISLGIAKVKTNSAFATSFINIQVYGGSDKPTTLLYSKKFDINKFYVDGMNYLPFDIPVKTTGNFFITYNIQELHPGDTLAVYMANRSGDTTNSFFLKNNNGWSSYNSQNPQGIGSALLTELIACGINLSTKIDSFDIGVDVTIFPNPMNGTSILTVRTKNQLNSPSNMAVYDLLGKEQNISFIIKGPNELMLNFSGKQPGIYFVHLKAGGRTIVGKIAYIP